MGWPALVPKRWWRTGSGDMGPSRLALGGERGRWQRRHDFGCAIGGGSQCAHDKAPGKIDLERIVARGSSPFERGGGGAFERVLAPRCTGEDRFRTVRAPWL